MIFLMSTSSPQAMDDAFKEDREESKHGVIQEESSKKALTREAADALMNEHLCAPEGETRNNVDLKSPDVLQFISNLRKEVAHWEKIQKAYSELKAEDRESCGKFAILCLMSYSELKNNHNQPAIMDFFLSPQSFPYLRKCIGDGKSKDERLSHLELLHYYIYSVIIETSFGQKKYEKTETALLMATALRPRATILNFNDLIQRKFFEGSPPTPKVSPPYFEKACSLYEKALKFAGFTEDNYDVNDLIALTILNFHSGKLGEVIKHGNRALKLKQTCPKNEEYAMQMTKKNLRKAIIEARHSLKSPQEEKNIYLSGPINEEIALRLALIYKEEKDWANAYAYLQLAYQKMYEVSHYFDDKNDLFLFLELLLDLESYIINNIKNEKFNFKKLQIICIENVKNNFPQFKEDIAELITSKKKRKTGNLIKKILMKEKISICKTIMSNFDQKYKSVWIKTSQIPKFQDPVYLKLVDEVNELSATIEEAYAPLKELSTENFEKNFQVISTSHDRLESLFKMFKDKADKVCLCVKDEIVRLAQLKAGEVLPPSSYHEAPVNNLKKEYRHQKGEKKEKEKENEKEKVKEKEKEKGNIPPENYGNLRSFSNKDDAAKNIWNCRNTEPNTLTAFEQSALNLLKSLDQASSMYHLKQLVSSRTNLEKLHDDRAGQLSLRVNKKYRLCFRWITGEGAYDVEITKHYKKNH